MAQAKTITTLAADTEQAQGFQANLVAPADGRIKEPYRRGGTVSRNNSATSSDSGYPRQSSRNATRTSVRIRCACGQSTPSIASTSSSSSSASSNAVDCLSAAISSYDQQASPGHDKDPNSDDTRTTTAVHKSSGPTPPSTDAETTPKANDDPQSNLCKTHHPNCSYASRPKRASARLQPSPSSVSSYSNASSLFRDDGFEDDLASTSDQASLIFHRLHRLSFQGNRYSHYDLLHRHGEEETEYQSCEEDFSHSHTTASTASNTDDCSLSVTSSSLINIEQPAIDKATLATVKQQYRRSLLLEQQQLNTSRPRNQQDLNHQSKIQALLLTPPQLCTQIPSSANLTTPTPTSVNPSQQSKQSKCDDRTVNIIGHMPTKSPGYWDSNLSITQRVVTEIIETERTYVDDLEQIVTGYICYLRNVHKQQKLQMQSNRSNNTNNNQPSRKDSATMVNQADRNNDENSPTNDVDDEDDDEVEGDVVIKSQIQTDGQYIEKIDDKLSNVVSNIDIKKLFSNLEDIYKFNKDLLFRLEECYLNPSSVAECFVENASGFGIYTHYCTMYPEVVATLTGLMANPISAQLLKERQNELNQGLPLGAYLLKPVQRILKYHILFQSLIKHTALDETVNEKDRQLIGEAFSVMTNIACHINAMKKRHEHSIRVQEVQGLLSGWEGPDLTTLGELILEDTFKLVNRQKSTRHLFLFDNVLLMTKKKRDGSLCYKGHIECSNLMLIENIEGQPLVFNTVPFDNPKALCAFQSKNLEKKRDWCIQMKDVIIKSFDNKIPVHVRDLLISLTSSDVTEASSKSSETTRALKALNYLEKKRTRQLKKK